MNIEEYFGKWMKVTDKKLLLNTIKQIDINTCTPNPIDWFRAFEYCDYDNLKIIDHIDGNKRNNDINNLELVTAAGSVTDLATNVNVQSKFAPYTL